MDKGLPTAALPVVEEAIGVLFADWISAVGLHISLLIFQVLNDLRKILFSRVNFGLQIQEFQAHIILLKRAYARAGYLHFLAFNFCAALLLVQEFVVLILFCMRLLTWLQCLILFSFLD